MSAARRKKEPVLQIVTVKPEPCQFLDGFSLGTLAYMFKTTTTRISGAIRALKLTDNTMRVIVKMEGTVAPRQQTWVHRSELKGIQRYLEERWLP